ncbi:ABC transporter substrate-binding protein [Herbiconiux sp. L3-i23]|uniref:peptide ABC transporter substrate-binding protein n=1 Tax=Herbiconiux sp. L3-i23 TaxID=2905871 RepID=UPI0020465E21|nr:ABC transporter substrate-binding protein [Herbiconiux sp. L3-i23]BDI23508.1 ABC transporter substrate-binding protein [Herbiconiux sp. L3-i23]
MKLSKLSLGGLALVTAGALTLAGCASGDGGDSSGGSGDTSAIITANGSEPENPLIPTGTTEVGGGKILDSIFAGLVSYGADGSPENDMAASIETEDSQTFTITVEEGHEFTNGEPVDADSFINAWKDGALLSNERLNSYFFEDIQGFSYDEDADLTGLQKVDDYTFTVALNEPRSDFPLRLGYSAFYPLPDSAFDADGRVTDEFGENPVGNGPYMLDGDDAWQHDVQIDLVTNPDYDGPRAPQNGGLTIVFYATQDAAYADLLAGNLDVLDAIPDSNFATFEDDLGDRAINQPAAVFQSFTIPSDTTEFANPAAFSHWIGEEGQLRRQALSMAIDRQQITDVIFDGTRTPASDFTSPTIDGWSDSLEGAEVLEYNPERAVELWAEADAISPFEGSFQISYNADGGHQGWVDAVANSVSNTLGIQASGNPIPTFAEARTQITGKTTETAFRTGWQADYPGLYNFLGPLYATNASSNDGDYSSAEFDSLLSEGAATADADEANALFQQAQEVLLKDLPAIPLWYSNVTGGYSEGVSNVEFDWHSVPLYYEITKG